MHARENVACEVGWRDRISYPARAVWFCLAYKNTVSYMYFEYL